MNRLLLIIDPQIDFITGTLPVPGAAEAMDALAEYITATDGRYACKAITADWHPWGHMSFAEAAGPWPRHCVAYSAGAAIWPSVLEACCRTAGPSEVLTKGTDKDTEEYSVERNERSAQRLGKILTDNAIDVIDVCGIAGDVCVHDSITDLAERYGAAIINVLAPFCPSLDGGERLNQLIDKLSLTCDR